MLARIENACARAGRRAAMGTFATLLLAVGLAFLTTALWIFLVVTFGALEASLIIGLGYFGAGLVLFGIMMSGSKSANTTTETSASTARSHPSNGATAPPMVEAFLYGLQAGSEASKARHN